LTACPDTPIVAAAAFARTMPAAVVLTAIADGLRAGGWPQPELCAIEPPDGGRAALAALLDASDFDARMRRARAVVVAERCVSERTLPGCPTFEIATRARQAGVPAYAVLGENCLDSFDARILDLQVILEARTTRGLIAAGRKLARLI